MTIISIDLREATGATKIIVGIRHRLLNQEAIKCRARDTPKSSANRNSPKFTLISIKRSEQINLIARPIESSITMIHTPTEDDISSQEVATTRREDSMMSATRIQLTTPTTTQSSTIDTLWETTTPTSSNTTDLEGIRVRVAGTTVDRLSITRGMVIATIRGIDERGKPD